MNNSSAVDRMNHTKCSSGVSTTFTVALSTVSFLAIIGNLLVIVTLIKTLNLKTSSNYYIVNIAVSDLLICVSLSWPLYATEGMLKAGGSLIGDPTLATLFCKLGIHSRAVSYVVSIQSSVLILVDRFIAIVFSLRALNITRTRTIFLFLSWFLPLLSLVPCFVHAEIIKIEQNTFCRNIMSDSALKIYHFLNFILFYCAPLILILVLYPLIMKHLRRRAKLDKGYRGTIQASRVKQNENIMKIFGSVALGFFTCWTPLYVYLFPKMLYPSIFIKDKSAVFVGLFYYIFPLLSTAVNPLILITFSSNYRAALKDLFSRLFPKMSFRKRITDRKDRKASRIESINMNNDSPKS